MTMNSSHDPAARLGGTPSPGASTRVSPGMAREQSRRAPRIIFTSGAEIEERVLRSMWHFRRRVMTLKPAVDLEVDWKKYLAFARRADIIVRLEEDSGAVCGTGMFAIEEGPDWVLALLEYTFLAPGLEGHPMLVQAGIRLMLEMLRIRRGRRLFAAGAGYPVSILLMGRYWPPLYLDGDPAPDAQIASVLSAARARLAGERAEHGCVELPTLPPEPPPWWFEKVKNDATFARYSALNPRWRAGFGLVSVAEIRPRHALVFCTGLARRKAERLWRRLRGAPREPSFSR